MRALDHVLGPMRGRGALARKGIPNTLTDHLNRAAIADGTCRLVQGDAFEGFRFWHHTERVARVLTALNTTPPTAGPSRFTLQADEALATACAATASGRQGPRHARGAGGPVQGGGAGGQGGGGNATFTVAARAAALDNWFRALCVPASAKPWGGAANFDPAYMPAQVRRNRSPPPPPLSCSSKLPQTAGRKWRPKQEHASWSPLGFRAVCVGGQY